MQANLRSSAVDFELKARAALLPKLMSARFGSKWDDYFTQGMFIYKYDILLNMPRSAQTGSSTRRHYIRHAIRPKRIADVVGLQILSEEDWKETRADLKKINKDTLSRFEKTY